MLRHYFHSVVLGCSWTWCNWTFPTVLRSLFYISFAWYVQFSAARKSVLALHHHIGRPHLVQTVDVYGERVADDFSDSWAPRTLVLNSLSHFAKPSLVCFRNHDHDEAINVITVQCADSKNIDPLLKGNWHRIVKSSISKWGALERKEAESWENYRWECATIEKPASY